MSDTTVVDTPADVSNAHIQDSVASASQTDPSASTTDPADTAASGQPKEGEGAQPDRPSRDRRAEKRIASLTRKNDEAQREIGYWRGQAEALRGSGRAAEDQADAKPQPNQYKSYDEYVDALTDWKVDQKLKARERGTQPKDEDRTEPGKADPRATRLASRLQEDGKDVEGFRDAMQIITAPGFPISPTMRDYLEDADRPAQMAVWLSDNPRKALRIYGMDPVDAEAELDRVAATLGAKARTTTAPPPGPTVGGRAVPSRDPEKMDMDEYAAHWRKRNGIKD